MDTLPKRDENADQTGEDMAVLTCSEMFSLLYFLYCKISDSFNKRLRQKQSSLTENMMQLGRETASFACLLGVKFDEIYDMIMVGSTGEGTCIKKSDTDSMIVLKCFQCCDPSLLEIYKQQRKCVFVTDRLNASPGYLFMLGHKLSFPDVPDNELRNVNLQICGEFQIPVSSRLFRDKFPKGLETPLGILLSDTYWKNPLQRFLVVHVVGPAINLSLRVFSLFLDYDVVPAIPYEDRTLLMSWVKRNRCHGWPQQELIAEISKMSGYLVPIGRKGSQLEQYEWRICYSLAERQLIRSLNEVQLMLYLRMKAKCKSNVKCMPSYIIKNLILWLAEVLPQHVFQEKHYFALEYATMASLRWCVKNGKLPCYMIPERNLIADKLTADDKQTILKQLNEYLPKYYSTFFASLMKTECTNFTPQLLKFCENLRESERGNFLEKYQRKQNDNLSECDHYALMARNIVNHPAFIHLSYTIRLCHVDASRLKLKEIIAPLLAVFIKTVAKGQAKNKLHKIYDLLTSRLSRLYDCMKSITVWNRKKVPVTVYEVSLAVVSFWLHVTTI